MHVNVKIWNLSSSAYRTVNAHWNKKVILFHFYRAAYHEKAVRPSVKRGIFDKMKESCAYIFTPYEKPFILVFCKEEWSAGDAPST